MKKTLLLSLILINIYFFQSCVDKIVVVEAGNPGGKLILKSDPPGAQIYLLGTYTNKLTPDSIIQLKDGNYDVTLKKQNYHDTTFVISVYDTLTISKNVVLKSTLSTGNIFIETEPSGAEILLDSIKTNQFTPDTLKNISKGEHLLTLKKNNYRDTTISITIEEDLTVSKIVKLKSITPVGDLFIESVPSGAQIFLDSLNTNKLTPDTLRNLTTGEHSISIKKENYNDTTFKVTIIENQTVSKSIVLLSTTSVGNIFLQSTPEDAQIYVDSINTNKLTPYSLNNLTTGQHQITLKKENYKDTTLVITVIKNQVVSKTVILTSKIITGNILIDSNPAGAQIYLDNKNTNKSTPDTLENLTAGEHNIILKKNNYVDTSFVITVQKNNTTTKSITLTAVIIRGNVYLDSSPSGAQIFVDNVNTNKVTPDSVKNLISGNHNIKLKKENYRDTTFQINVIGYITVSKQVVMASLRGGIFIESSPNGAGIYINDKYSDKTTPDTIKNLVFGTYKVSLKYPNYNDTTFYVDVSPNTITYKNINLTQKIDYGKLYIQTNPSGANIFIDNSNTGKLTPDTVKNLEVGNYNVTLKLTDYNDTTFSVNIQKDFVTLKNINLREKQAVQIDTLYYGFILLGQTRFTFSFNQDITLDNVDIIEPGSSNKTSFDYGGESINKGSTRNIYYPQFKVGEWHLIFYGKKASSSKSSFTLQKTLTIP